MIPASFPPLPPSSIAEYGDRRAFQARETLGLDVEEAEWRGIQEAQRSLVSLNYEGVTEMGWCQIVRTMVSSLSFYLVWMASC